MAKELFYVEEFEDKRKATERANFLRNGGNKNVSKPPKPEPTYHEDNDAWLVVYTIKL